MARTIGVALDLDLDLAAAPSGVAPTRLTLPSGAPLTSLTGRPRPDAWRRARSRGGARGGLGRRRRVLDGRLIGMGEAGERQDGRPGAEEGALHGISLWLESETAGRGGPRPVGLSGGCAARRAATRRPGRRRWRFRRGCPPCDRSAIDTMPTSRLARFNTGSRRICWPANFGDHVVQILIGEAVEELVAHHLADQVAAPRPLATRPGSRCPGR